MRRISRAFWVPLLVLSCGLSQQATAQTADVTPKEKISRIRELARRRTDALTAIEPYLKDSDPVVREEAVRALVRIGGADSLSGLVQATRDNDASVQLRALDGLVNYYLPGYVPSGLTAPVTKGVRSAKSVVATRNDQVIDPAKRVSPGINEAVGQLIVGGASLEVRRGAARAAGILRDQSAVEALGSSLRAHDSALIFECLVALQKIKARADVPALASAAHDLDEKTQITALETIGNLRSQVSAPDVRAVLKNPRDIRVQRAALECLAMLGQAQDRPEFQQNLTSTDPAIRASALEGLGRIREPEDYPVLDSAYNEANADWRVHLAAAFGLVNLGKAGGGDFSPLAFLIENLSNRSRGQTASEYLREVVRHPAVREALVPMAPEMDRDGKLALCSIAGESGEEEFRPMLMALTQDANPDVATAASKSLKALTARSNS